MVDEFSRKASKSFEKKQKYEERNYMRLQTSKRELVEERRKRQMDVLDELLSFGDYMPSERMDKRVSKKGKKGSKKAHPKPKKKWRSFRK